MQKSRDPDGKENIDTQPFRRDIMKKWNVKIFKIAAMAFLFCLTLFGAWTFVWGQGPEYGAKLDKAWFVERFKEVERNVRQEASRPSFDTWMSAYTKEFGPIKGRSTGEVYWEHIALRFADDVSTDVKRNYSDELVLISNQGNFYGKKGLATSARILYSYLPNTNYTIVDTVVQGDWVTERWAYYDSEANKMVLDGIDTFLIEDGQIKVMMINYNPVEADISYAEFLTRLGLSGPE
jgi:predicted SnoaL-like aldol condensation-catalyzing enzyme